VGRGGERGLARKARSSAGQRAREREDNGWREQRICPDMPRIDRRLLHTIEMVQGRGADCNSRLRSFPLSRRPNSPPRLASRALQPQQFASFFSQSRGRLLSRPIRWRCLWWSVFVGRDGDGEGGPLGRRRRCDRGKASWRKFPARIEVERHLARALKELCFLLCQGGNAETFV
jgi:hypothetical protein